MKKNRYPTPVELSLGIFALWTFAVSKPILDVLAHSPEYWTANRIGSLTIVLSTFLVSILVPLLASCVFYLSSSKEMLSRIGNLLFACAFLVLGTASIFHALSLSVGKPILLMAGSLIGASLVLIIYMRSSSVRLVFNVFSAAALIVPISFLFIGPTSSILGSAAPEKKNSNDTLVLEGPLVIIVFDEMNMASLIDSNGDIDSRLFPNFYKLKNSSTWMRNATTNYGTTERSLPSFLTGKFQEKKVANASYKQSPISLFTLVNAPDGVFTEEPVTNLCPPEICVPRLPDLDEQFRVVRDDFWLIYQNIMVPDELRALVRPIPKRFRKIAAQNESDIRSSRIITDESQIAKKLENWFGEGRTKSLIFMHFGVPHAPYNLNADGSAYTSSSSYSLPGWNPDGHKWLIDKSFYVAQAFQRYLLQAMYSDSVLGNVSDVLHENGLFDSSTIIVTSDHGVAFVPGKERRSDDLDGAVIEENNVVPFFWKFPNQKEGSINNRNVELIDFVPSLIESLGGDPSEFDLDGESIFSGGERELKSFSNQTYPGVTWAQIQKARDRLFDSFDIIHNKDGSYFPRYSAYQGFLGALIDSAEYASAIVKVNNADVFQHLRLPIDKRVISPNFISGQVISDQPINLLGISLNKKIVDVVETYEGVNHTRHFASIFNPNLIKPNSNELAIYSISKTSSADFIFQRLVIEDNSYLFQSGVIRDKSGNSLERDDERFIGAIDQFDFRVPGILNVAGWMGDRKNWKPPVAILVLYRGDQFLSNPTVYRPDLEKLNSDLTMSGFKIGIRLKGVNFNVNHLRMFAIYEDGIFAELEMRVGMQ